MWNPTSLLRPSIHFEAGTTVRYVRVLRRLKLSAAFSEQCSQALEDREASRLLGNGIERALQALDAQAVSDSCAFDAGVATGSVSFRTASADGRTATVEACFDERGCMAGLSIRFENSCWCFRIDTSGTGFLLDRYRGEGIGFRRHCTHVSRDPYLSPFNAALARLRTTAPIRCRVEGGLLVYHYRFVHCFEPDSSAAGDCYDMRGKAVFDSDLRLHTLSLVVPGTDWHAEIGE